MIVKILIAVWTVSISLELYLIIRKYKADKAHYRFVVCTQQGTNLVPIDCFNCETDARAHYAQQANTVIVRMTSSDFDWYREHVSK